jgi:hypothetical protein
LTAALVSPLRARSSALWMSESARWFAMLCACTSPPMIASAASDVAAAVCRARRDCVIIMRRSSGSDRRCACARRPVRARYL